MRWRCIFILIRSRRLIFDFLYSINTLKKWIYGYMKIIYENCRVKNNMKEDHRSYRRKFCSCGKKAWKILYWIRNLDLCDASETILRFELTSPLGAGHCIGKIQSIININQKKNTWGTGKQSYTKSVFRLVPLATTEIFTSCSKFSYR